MIEYILSPQSVEALGWTLLHSLWQGAAFAILLVLILIALRCYTPQSRYVVAVGLLFAFFLTVSATFWQQWQQATSPLEVTASLVNTQTVNDVSTINNSTVEILPSDNGSNSTVTHKSQIVESNPSSWLLTFKNYYDQHLPLLVTIWLLGVLFLQLRFLGQLAYVQRLKHYGTQLLPLAWSDKIEELEGKLRIQKKVKYLTSIRIDSPMVIGWLQPVVLLPQKLFSSLPETEIYAILAHELAHIRREDFIVNLLQTFLCNVFFFHPGVWWMSNRVDDEREHCCDDLAVAATGSATTYAETLINVSALQLSMQKNTPLAVAFSGKNKKRERGGFSSRIRRLFIKSNSTGSFREGFASACILIAALFFGVVATGSTIQATDSPTPLELDKTKNTLVIEEKPISKVSQEEDLSKFPMAAPAKPAPPAKIASPAKPAPPEEPAPPVKSAVTRIDALVMACEEGDFDFVKTLVNSGIDVNGISSEGFTPLMMATSNDEVEIVDYLLQQGADVNQTVNGWTALIEAADEGSLTSMKLLLKADADINYYWGQDSPTAISMAASEGHLECLRLLVENGADINGISKSIPPLHIAAAEGKRGIIDYLISQKVDLDKKDVAGRTALMYGAAEGQKHTVIKLLEAGADKSIMDSNGSTAKSYAKSEEEYDTMEVIEGQNTDLRGKQSEERGQYSKIRGKQSDERGARPAIHQATQDGLIEKVQRMVQQGTDVNTRDDYGRTALHLAAALNHTIDMQVLIELGADVNAQDKQGRTPMMYAAADGEGDAVALLVSKDANVHIADVDGMRAYEWSRSGGNAELAKFLALITENKTQSDHTERHRHRHIDDKSSQKEIEKSIQKEVEREVQKAIKEEYEKREIFHVAADGTHLTQFNMKEKAPALLEAARYGSVEDCNSILNNGLTANSADGTGQTALMVAARGNRLKIAKFLIERGADVNKSSASGLTALHYAALENHDQMARLLLKHHAKVDATMRYSSTDGNYSKEPLVWEYIGATPLLIATESGNTEVLSVLINAGANPNHMLIRNEYRFNKDRVHYLTGSEVTGIDQDFLKEVDIKIIDDSWTPYKQALLLNKPDILVFFQK